VTGAVTGAHDPDLLDRAAAAFQAATDQLTDRFQQLGLSTAQATRRAAILVTAAEGAVILARARRSVEPLQLIADHLHEPGS
jgi:hypothetical protein